jgi:hypothetical protein
MSEENVYKQKFEIAQWPTSKVVLFPTRATIFREIQGVRLKVILIPQSKYYFHPNDMAVLPGWFE